MKRLIALALAVSIVSFCVHSVEAHSPKAAEQDLSAAASKLESAIMRSLNAIASDLRAVAEKVGAIDTGREMEIRKLLLGLTAGRPYVIDVTFVDDKGIMKIVEPGQYKKYEGSDISKQEQIVWMQKTKKPVMSKIFDSVEGVRSVDIEYPVLSGGKTLHGSVSMLVKQEELIRGIAAPLEKELGIQCVVMQKDGATVYDTDQNQLGLNVFKDSLYKNYPELVSLARQMVKQRTGTGSYSFMEQKTDRLVKKEAAWGTISFFNNEWIVAAYKEVK